MLAEAWEGVKTELDADFPEAWRFYAQLPDTEVTRWLRVGAHTGITRHPLGSRLGIFPPAGEKSRDVHEPTYYKKGWNNYESVEGGTSAADQIHGLEITDFVDAYGDFLEASQVSPRTWRHWSGPGSVP